MRKPIHPYTKSLLAAVPFPDLDRPLDFKALHDNGARETQNWGAQFRDERDENASSLRRSRRGPSGARAPQAPM